LDALRQARQRAVWGWRWTERLVRLFGEGQTATGGRSPNPRRHRTRARWRSDRPAPDNLQRPGKRGGHRRGP